MVQYYPILGNIFPDITVIHTTLSQCLTVETHWLKRIALYSQELIYGKFCILECNAMQSNEIHLILWRSMLLPSLA